MTDTMSSARADAPIVNKKGTMIDVVVAWISWAVIVAIMVFVAMNFDARSPGERVMVVLAGLGGGTMGWAGGLILTPYDAGEGRTFGDLFRGFYGLITGYVVAKIDPMITALVQIVIDRGVPTLAAVEVGIGMVSFVAATAVTFVSRKYWA